MAIPLGLSLLCPGDPSAVAGAGLARLKNFAGSAAPEAARGALTRTLLTGGRAAHLMVR
jgi:hypothetical protein